MKKYYIGFILVVFFLCGISVNALEYPLNTLIPVNTVASVRTELFDYNDFSYSSNVNAKGNAMIRFASIHNNRTVKPSVFVSINILLFNKNKTNIGFLTYCSEKDYDGEYASYKLKPDGYSSFSITVSKKYFGEEWAPKDVEYIAVMDDNEFCHIGGYTNYLGKTLEEIVDKSEERSTLDKIIQTIQDFMKTKLFSRILLGFGVFLGFVILGIGINSLYKKMYRQGTIFAYLPITDMIVTMRVVYGKIIAIIYLVGIIVAGVLCIFKIYLVAYIMIGIWILSYLFIFVKLITKNYDLFYLEPSMDTSNQYDIHNTIPSTYDFNNMNTNISTNNNINTSINTNTDLSNSISTGSTISTGSNSMNPPINNNDMNQVLLDDEEEKSLFDDDF